MTNEVANSQQSGSDLSSC